MHLTFSSHIHLPHHTHSTLKEKHMSRKRLIENSKTRYATAGLLALITIALVWASRLAFSKAE